MEIAYLNGKFLPKNEITISPDDRGFLFADGVYEVARWYEGFLYDISSHVTRLKRGLRELRINWNNADLFPSIANDLIKLNKLETQPAMVYLQVTRGAARRTHSFPSPEVNPTVYAYAWGFTPSRCDIKSVALLPNTLSYQEACEKGMKECIFVRNGLITEGSHSNIFFVLEGTLYTHPESNHILSGITRKNILRIAMESGIKIREEALQENMIRFVKEAFISNTSAEMTPLNEIGGNIVGEQVPGPITRLIRKKFDAEILALKGQKS
jgi:D-alanine transaminase